MNKVVILSEKWLPFCEFAQLYITIVLFSARDKSRDPGANCRKLEHMQTTLDQSISFEESQQIDCIDLQMKLANQKMDLSGFEALDTNYNDKIDTHEATHVLDITGMAISVVEFPPRRYKVRQN